MFSVSPLIEAACEVEQITPRLIEAPPVCPRSIWIRVRAVEIHPGAIENAAILPRVIAVSVGSVVLSRCVLSISGSRQRANERKSKNSPVHVSHLGPKDAPSPAGFRVLIHA
jgi:hypothetical protein